MNDNIQGCERQVFGEGTYIVQPKHNTHSNKMSGKKSATARRNLRVPKPNEVLVRNMLLR